MSTNGEQLVKNTERAFKHLIVPMLLVYMLIVGISILKGHEGMEIRDYITNRINTLLYSSGASVSVFDATIPALGLLWFVIALFISRQLFDYLHLRCREPWFICLVILLAICGVGVSHFQWLPLSFDIVLAVFPFLWMGMKIKTIDLDKGLFIWGAISILIWAVTLFLTFKTTHTYLELAIRNYPLFPLCYLTAAAGTMSVIFAGKLTTRYIGSHGLGLTWVGRNSMTLYLIHALDYNLIGFWKLDDSDALSAFIRVSMDILFCIAFANIKRIIKDGRRKKGKERG